MRLVATYDCLMNLGSGEELVLRGQEFTPPATGIMSVPERCRMMIRQGVAVPAEDWPERQKKTQAGHEWAKAFVAQARADYAALMRRAGIGGAS